ncbi:undecaprenyldiphospho-muramoylpentapeptide beta-N-acetylglucosaminyltransferase [Aliikangiella marina]|uniref:UDP-N-acetylglucosamine--N-acetylmuramyl-(pentapeptide) pyrophosphoryl-undecaprenol N-acetylglucosamine transferase n=2 Tax=Aliikangiella marina TaxID=1712262 RepID=A0A545TEI6_9GAMM|nr:undecaprenyldiphospho-muramoylpentapeptide beta-N-acetylglucosaminyltransferase [Aliikangiella marina]
MAGGTGGHIFPGLAVAEELESRGWQAIWLGSKGGMEEELVAKSNIELNLISVSGLRGKGVIGWLKAPYSLSKAVIEAIKVLKKIKPKVVVGFGGFASGPGGVAAFLTGTPLVIHEQNAVAGMTNRILSRLAKKVFQAFPGAFIRADKVETVGNPIRQSIVELRNKKETPVIEPKKLINVLVVGGSRGALALNRLLPNLFKNLFEQELIGIRHQVGKGRKEESEKFYLAENIQPGERLEIKEFIDDMAEAMDWADVVICRAGASTVSEIAAAGLCAVFVPFPYAVDDHQTANANWLVAEQAAICIQERDLSTDETKAKLTELISSPEQIAAMAKKAKQVAYLTAATKVADFCEDLRMKAA